MYVTYRTNSGGVKKWDNVLSEYLIYLENLILHLPDLSTQDEVVSLCDELSLNALQTQSKFEEQLTYLKNLKSSILSKAFAGEL